MIAEIQNYILSEIKAISALPVSVGPMPANEGIGLYIASGNPIKEFLPRTDFQRVVFALNAKSQNQLTALSALEKIHSHFNAKGSFLNTNLLQITHIRTNGAPTFTGQQNNEWYLFGSSLLVQYFDKEEV